MYASRVARTIAGSLLAGVAVLACGNTGSGTAETDAATSVNDSEAGPSFGGGGTSDFPDDASIRVQARYVLAAGCVGGPESACHSVGIGVQGLVLPDTTPTNLVGVASTEEPAEVRVQPGDPLRSYLYWKVTADPRIKGVRMPKDSAPLDARSLGVLADWIDAGAP